MNQQQRIEEMAYEQGKAVMSQEPSFELALLTAPATYLQRRLDVDDLSDTPLGQDEIEAFSAQFCAGLIAYVGQHIEDELLYGTTTGEVLYLEISEATELSNPRCLELVVLDHDGRRIAYRYSDDVIDHEWQLGDAWSVAEEWAEWADAQVEADQMRAMEDAMPDAVAAYGRR
jgi:hypothetical protein